MGFEDLSVDPGIHMELAGRDLFADLRVDLLEIGDLLDDLHVDLLEIQDLHADLQASSEYLSLKLSKVS